jgi:tetratricopeptide (TPR) repeat protein
VTYEGLGDLPGLMNVRNNIGIVYRRESDWAEALREQNEALAIARRLGDGWGIGMVLANIAETLRSKGDFESALATNREALRVWTQTSYAVGVATVHMNIGILHAERAEYDDARAALRASLAEWERLDSRLFLPELYRTFAKVELETDPNLALTWARRSVDVARDIKARDEEGLALQTLGVVLARLEQRVQAAAELRSSVEVLRTTNNRLDLARSLTLLAEQSRHLGIAGADIMAFAREAAAIFADAGAAKERERAEAVVLS